MTLGIGAIFVWIEGCATLSRGEDAGSFRALADSPLFSTTESDSGDNKLVGNFHVWGGPSDAFLRGGCCRDTFGVLGTDAAPGLRLEALSCSLPPDRNVKGGGGCVADL